MVAITSFFIALMQSLALASALSPTQCSDDVESEKNVFQVCLQQDEDKPMLVLYRYLGSGEVEKEKFLLSALKLDQETEGDLTTSLIAKSLEDEELLRAKNFVRSPSTITK